MLLPSRPRAEQVARLVPHENASWDDASDLALLQLRVPVNLSVAPRPVCLPQPEHYFLPGSRCRLGRWGRGGEQGPGAERGGVAEGPTPPQRGFAPSSFSEPAPRPSTLLEAELLGGWWCHCLYGRQGASVPPPRDPPHALCPAYQEEEEEAGGCWVSGAGGACGSGLDPERPRGWGRSLRGTGMEAERSGGGAWLWRTFGRGLRADPGRCWALSLPLRLKRILKQGLTSYRLVLEPGLEEVGPGGPREVDLLSTGDYGIQDEPQDL